MTKSGTDSLSALYKNLSNETKDDLTNSCKDLLEAYFKKVQRINPGKSHENGGVESGHRHFKVNLKQSLAIRGSSDFRSLDELRSFIHEIVRKSNMRKKDKIEIERQHLKTLPFIKPAGYRVLIAVVSSSSTISIKRVTYSVPSKLIGERLTVRIYPDYLSCYLGVTHVLDLKRMPNPPRGKRRRSINYHHIIGSLVRKPGAFSGARYRDDILPNDNYRYIWSHLQNNLSKREAERLMVKLLYIAHVGNCQTELEVEVIQKIDAKQELNIKYFENRFMPKKNKTPKIIVSHVSIDVYNQLIPNYK